jgi:SAM-dependent methyltransferase
MGRRVEPASFRDPGGRVFYDGDQVLRGLSPAAAAEWLALARTEFFPRFVAEGRIVATEETGAGETGAGETGAGEDGWDVVLRHERIPFVSYPFEWSFAMLRDAALLHLSIVRAALAEGLTTKDGTAYNLQWRGAAPVFIDVGSFERARDGEPWAGYRQFCQTMLYPLMAQAHLGVDFQPWLRAAVDGIEPAQMRKVFGGFRRFKAGVLKHVHLHDAVQSRNAKTSTGAVRAELRDAGFNRELVLATVRALEKLVGKLEWRPPASHWTAYQQTCTYSDEDRAVKAEFVEKAAAGMVLDLGANDGTYSRIAAKKASYVVAVESDAAVVDELYRKLRADGETRILPLVMDLADPSPGIGWRGRERAPFAERADADLVLALAVIHHLAIGRNVPLPEVVDALAGLGRRVVVEFVEPDDPMARRLLANKPEGLFPDYRRDAFEKLLAERFTVEHRQELPSGTRTLYFGQSHG